MMCGNIFSFLQGVQVSWMISCFIARRYTGKPNGSARTTNRHLTRWRTASRKLSSSSSKQTPSSMLPSLELSLVEQWILATDSVSMLAVFQDYFGFLGSAASGAINWFLFRYHFINLLSYEFFILNYTTASFFARNRYNTFKVAAISFFPVGFAVIVFSIITRFNTVKFIEMFGTSKSFYFFKKPNKFKVKIKP